jgi:hypothetical protein
MTVQRTRLGTVIILASAPWIGLSCGDDLGNPREGAVPIATGQSLCWDAPCEIVSPDIIGGKNLDPNCTKSGGASTDLPCQRDCVTRCGFGLGGDALGLKFCACDQGIFTQCPCLPPVGWGGAKTAGMCKTPGGLALPLKDTSCEKEWDQCVGTDPSATGSVAPQGCVCLKQAGTGALLWDCRATNRWFWPDFEANP